MSEKIEAQPGYIISDYGKYVHYENDRVTWVDNVSDATIWLNKSAALYMKQTRTSGQIGEIKVYKNQNKEMSNYKTYIVVSEVVSILGVFHKFYASKTGHITGDANDAIWFNDRASAFGFLTGLKCENGKIEEIYIPNKSKAQEDKNE